VANSQHSKPVRLAHAALAAATAGKWKSVATTVERISTECPGVGLGDALVAWCDAIAEHSNDGMPEFGRVRVATLETDTGAMNAPSGQTPHIQWVGRLIAARAAGDRAAFEACMDELNAIVDGFERGRYVLQLVESVALTIRHLPRGYARMGSTQEA
jgi:hypothetical protein